MEVRSLSREEVATLNAALDRRMIRRTQAVQAAYVVAGGVSEGEVFTSDVLDVAGFLLGDDVVDASIVCGYRDGERECSLNDGHVSVVVEGIHRYGHVTRNGAVFDEEVPF